MTTPDTARIYDLLERQNEVLHAQGVQLATLIVELKSTNERLFGVGNTPGVVSVVVDHSKQLSGFGRQLGYVKGAAGVLTFLWSALVAIVVARISHH